MQQNIKIKNILRSSLVAGISCLPSYLVSSVIEKVFVI